MRRFGSHFAGLLTVGLGLVLVAGVGSATAQDPPTEEEYGPLMAEVRLLVGDVSQHIDNRYWPELGEDLDKLFPVFRQMEAFWTARGNESALGIAGEGIEALRAAPNLRPLGLMGMSPAGNSAEAATAAFTRLRDLADGLERDPNTAALFVRERVRTSMGMSGDFCEAIAAGADYLRIGSSFFEDKGREDTAREVPA